MPAPTSPPEPAAARPAYLAALAERVLIFDGAMGTSLQALGLTADDFGGRQREGCHEALVLTRPEVVAGVHRAFLEACCDVLETDTFGGSRLKLAEFGLAEQTHALNLAAARLARELADAYSTPARPRFVAGSLGPTGMLPSSDDPTLSAISFAELADVYAEQARALVEGGCDLLLLETCQDLLEVKAAVVGITRWLRAAGRRVPLQVQVTLDTAGRMLLGTDVAAVLTTLEALPVDVVGLNCSTGPEHMREPVRYLCAQSRLPVAVIPNAGIPRNVGGRAHYPLEPEPLAAALREFVVELGAGAVGGCCGTTPEHLRAVVAAVGDRAPRRRAVVPQPALAGAIRASPLRQEPAPLIVGERVNAQGSRRVKRLLLREDYDAVLALAREQVEGGAHALDVCVALTERADEPAMLARVVRKLATGVEAPLVLDSTEAEAIRQGLEAYPGRALINSVNLESGRGRLDAVCGLAREHGAAVIALTIDEQGMARTAERKLAVARRIHRIAVEEHGLRPADLVFDALTFTLTTGDPDLADSARETLTGIRRIKAELPGVLAVLGVSNVSFGVAPAARAALNSVFLYHAVRAGLDLAIVNPAEVTPYAEVPAEVRALCEDLIENRRPDALARFIQHFATAPELEGPGVAPAADEAAQLPVERRLHEAVLRRRKEGVEALLDEALRTRTPVEVLNDVLLPAMKDVGDRFGAGELILPFVLQSAEVMKRAVAYLERFLPRGDGSAEGRGHSKGKVVLATVFGDVHDIGKNLVATILSNNGYAVDDLGKQTPINRIVDRAVEVGADAIGLSALLVSTSKQMPLCVQELAARGLSIPVLIGGAAINRHFGRRTGLLPGGAPYAAGVFYCRDAFEGLAVVGELTDPARRAAAIERARSEALAEADRASAAPGGEVARGAAAARSGRSRVSTQVPVPAPPFWGVRTLAGADVPLSEVFDCLDLKTLFRLHWGGKGVRGEDWERLVEGDFGPRLARMQAAADYLTPRVVYGYFPCQSAGDELLVYAPEAPTARRLRARFAFPRQPAWDRLCLADYFRPVESGELDVVALQVVTVGPGAEVRVAALQARGDFAEAYFVHGLSVQSAEAAAEWAHRRVRRELGLAPEQGRRYSWGYPACPELADHAQVFELLGVPAAIGVSLTVAYQLVPEQSTAALVVHHPEAIYYSTRESAD